MKLDKSKLSIFGRWFNMVERDKGSFYDSLFDTFIKGSQHNRTKIAKAFPDYFNDLDVTLSYPSINEYDSDKMILLINSAQGIYIPQSFIKGSLELIIEWCANNNENFEDYRPLFNPEDEFYWESWEQMLNNYFTMINDEKYILYHNEDLWLIPEDMELPESF